MDHNALLMLPHLHHSRAKSYSTCGLWASLHTDGQAAAPISRAKESLGGSWDTGVGGEDQVAKT